MSLATTDPQHPNSPHSFVSNNRSGSNQLKLRKESFVESIGYRGLGVFTKVSIAGCFPKVANGYPFHVIPTIVGLPATLTDAFRNFCPTRGTADVSTI